jgi:hypothetical protein
MRINTKTRVLHEYPALIFLLKVLIFHTCFSNDIRCLCDLPEQYNRRFTPVISYSHKVPFSVGTLLKQGCFALSHWICGVSIVLLGKWKSVASSLQKNRTLFKNEVNNRKKFINKINHKIPLKPYLWFFKRVKVELNCEKAHDVA